MQAIVPYYEILDELDGQKILEKIEKVARTCYKSEDKIKEGSAEKMVAALIRSNHEAMLEHFSFSVKFVCDRGVSHEIVRHRLASFAQESQRYCNYGKDDQVTFILPSQFKYRSPEFQEWSKAMQEAEKHYLHLIDEGVPPQMARTVLPNSTKTEIVMTANLREFRHFFKLRAADATGAAHPQMKELTQPLLTELKSLIPVIFDDITYPGESVVKEDGKQKEQSEI